MKTNAFSQDMNQQVAQAPKRPPGANWAQGEAAVPPSPDAAARRSRAICGTPGSQPGPEAKHWLEAGAQLVGGVERESQMRPGSSLFKSEQ